MKKFKKDILLFGERSKILPKLSLKGLRLFKNGADKNVDETSSWKNHETEVVQDCNCDTVCKLPKLKNDTLISP